METLRDSQTLHRKERKEDRRSTATEAKNLPAKEEGFGRHQSIVEPDRAWLPKNQFQHFPSPSLHVDPPPLEPACTSRLGSLRLRIGESEDREGEKP